jgi:hypothetical protein
METEKHKDQRETHERVVADRIAEHLKKRREHQEQFWIEFNKKKEANNG